MPNDDQILLDEELLDEHLFKELTKIGYAITEDESADIASIVFEYLVTLGMEVDDDANS